MDRRALPAIPAPPPPRPTYPSLPPAASGAFAVPAPFTTSGTYAAVMHATLEDSTRPSIRRRRQVSTYRRLIIALAIGFAFAAGIATALAFELAERTPDAVFVQVPRDAITRSETFAGAGASAKAVPAADDAKREAKPRPRRAVRLPPEDVAGEPEAPPPSN